MSAEQTNTGPAPAPTTEAATEAITEGPAAVTEARPPVDIAGRLMVAQIVVLALMACFLGGWLLLLPDKPRSAKERLPVGGPTHEGVAGTSTYERPRRPLLGDMPAFSLTDHRGQTIDKVALAGKPFVLQFFFACCDKSCPMMVQQMAEMQKTHQQAGLRFVSITVDPERDDPAALATHAKRFAEMSELENIDRWHLLTGKKFDIVKLLDQFNLPVSPTWMNEAGPLGHIDKFLLVDAQGRLRGLYQYNDEQQMAELAEDLPALLAEQATSSAKGE